MNIAVDCLAPAEITLQRKGPDAVSFDQNLKHIQLQPLKLCVSVGRFTQSCDLRLLRECEF